MDPRPGLGAVLVIYKALSGQPLGELQCPQYQRGYQQARLNKRFPMLRRSQLRMLCDGIYSTLPREIRDMIFEDLARPWNQPDTPLLYQHEQIGSYSTRPKR